MAYILHHTIEFNNPVTEQIRIELYKKDTPISDVIPLRGTYVRKQVLSGKGDGSDTILSSELTFGLWVREDSGVDFTDFIVSFHDEWKVIMYSENQIEFIGFLTPSEGESSLIGIRNEVTLSATDNLGLIKKTLLKKYDGTIFNDFNRIIDYIVGALAQTNLQLNVVVYANIYDSLIVDRNANNTNDTFNQYKLNYATFLEDALTFKDCSTCLEMILGEGYTLEQHFGKWVIMRIGEMQGTSGPKIWCTEYDYTGAIVEATLLNNDPAIVDKDQTLHPIDGDLKISSNYSVWRAKHTYNYTPWPELPKNNTFERGTLIPGVGNADQKAYSIADWVFGVWNPNLFSGPGSSPFNLAPTTDLGYRLSTYNLYGVETAREIVLDSHFNDPQPGHRLLRCKQFPIKAGDRVDIDFDFKRTPGGTGTMNYMLIALEPVTGVPRYTLDNNDPADGGKPFFWKLGGGVNFISKFYQGENWGDWGPIQVECPPAPVDGTFFIFFLNYDSAFTSAFYRNFQVTYHPFVAGGYVEAKGDYWNTQQSTKYLDDIDEEVFISDSEVKVLKGAIFRSDESTLTTRSWFRLNVNESRGYKELINIARYNQAYRRMWKLSGTIGGMGYYPGNNQGIRLPLSFHKHFIFPGIPKVSNIFFQLVPPLTIDYSAGSIKANFRESWQPGLNDGDQVGNVHEFKYKF